MASSRCLSRMRVRTIDPADGTIEGEGSGDIANRKSHKFLLRSPFDGSGNAA